LERLQARPVENQKLVREVIDNYYYKRGAS
jgi:hypothetical protein